MTKVGCAGNCGKTVRRPGRFCNGCLESIADELLDRLRYREEGTQLTVDALNGTVVQAWEARMSVGLEDIA